MQKRILQFSEPDVLCIFDRSHRMPAGKKRASEGAASEAPAQKKSKAADGSAAAASAQCKPAAAASKIPSKGAKVLCPHP